MKKLFIVFCLPSDALLYFAEFTEKHLHATDLVLTQWHSTTLTLKQNRTSKQSIRTAYSFWRATRIDITSDPFQYIPERFTFMVNQIKHSEVCQ